MKISPSWIERLVAAEKTGHFTPNDKAKISTFTSCMVGEKFNIPIKRDWDITSKYGYELHNLGVRALVAVICDQVSKARRIYDKIQSYKIPKKHLERMKEGGESKNDIQNKM